MRKHVHIVVHFIQVVIPELEAAYGNQMDIIQMDIDEESSLEA